MTTVSDVLYQMGGVPVLSGIPFSQNSQAWFVDPANGNNNNDGQTVDTAFADIAQAHSSATANQHDVVFYIAGSSSISLSSALTWSKSYTHLIGLCAPTNVAQRARIFQTSTLTGASPLLTISATGCIFANFYIFQGVNDATSLINVSVTGGRNYFYNVHFAGGGHATQAIDGGASLKLDGAAECLFKDCTIGIDTIAAATGMANVIVDSAATRNIFDGCLFLLYAGNAGAKHVEIADNAGMDRYLIFKNCLFVNDAVANTLTEAFTIPGSLHSATNFIILDHSYCLGSDDLDSNDRGVLYSTEGTKTGGTNASLLLVSAA